MPTREQIQWVMDNYGVGPKEAPSLAAWIEQGGQMGQLGKGPVMPQPQTPQYTPEQIADAEQLPMQFQVYKEGTPESKQEHLENIHKLHQQRRQQIEQQLYDIFGLMHPDSAQNIGQGLAGPAEQEYNNLNPMVQSATAAYPNPLAAAASAAYPSPNPSPQTPLITNPGQSQSKR